MRDDPDAPTTTTEYWRPRNYTTARLIYPFRWALGPREPSAHTKILQALSILNSSINISLGTTSEGGGGGPGANFAAEAASLLTSALLELPRPSSKRVSDETQDPILTPPSLAQSLPAEVLVHIFSYARDAAVAPTTHDDPEEYVKAPYVKDVSADSKAMMGTEGAALRFVAGLGRVLFRRLYIRHGLALLRVIKILEDCSASRIASTVSTLDVLIPAVAALQREDGSWQDSQRDRIDPETRHNRDGGKLVARLLKTLPELRSFRLVVKKGETTEGEEGYWGSKAVPHHTFLEPTLFDAITTHLTGITTLVLDFCIDLQDLGLILHSLSTVAVLALSGIGNFISGQTNSPSHQNNAASLQILSVGTHSGELQKSILSSEQLRWLIEPAACSGSIKEVTLSLPCQLPLSLNNVPTVPAFASVEFADLLVGLAGLEKLDLSAPNGENQIFGSLVHPPHNGTFDFALSHLTSLHHLCLPAHLLGDSFISITSTLPALKTLEIAGRSRHLPTDVVLQALEPSTTNFSSLRRLRLHGQMSGRGGAVGWTAAQRRAVYRAAEARGVEVEVTEKEER
ncbi:hypothetical protein JCM6882_006908 [Rhodosporidiobolus microsporus]